ncbi:DUF2624 family protein [Bacillus hwajinpoensis]|uniref:DUF2624 family protein n=1 Tax=Guptibacillus hwajinpoensis TaxID=208199 RepID=A0A845EWX3_9BACL|nr:MULTISPECIES: DUF2624 family protein [Bacillaceae]MCA0992916.1 DUF2624 domain-containing protein [Pseudalkalibacillus hwajinpoensis]MYL63050.1 DUF2624 family protein [Pseudalkalibacillus hwajinpoensis]PFG13945.1 uncharacterized protein DUF2624 [Bacillus sp. es.036]
MNPIQLQLVNFKLNRITAEELLQLSKQYGITLTTGDAKKIVQILKQENIDIANQTQRKRILLKISREVSPSVASRVNKLMLSFLNQ